MPYRDGHALHSASEPEKSLGDATEQLERLEKLLADIQGVMTSHELMLRFDRKEPGGPRKGVPGDYKKGVKAAHDQIRRLIDRYERGDSNE